jgi:hypothetical protein
MPAQIWIWNRSAYVAVTLVNEEKKNKRNNMMQLDAFKSEI